MLTSEKAKILKLIILICFLMGGISSPLLSEPLPLKKISQEVLLSESIMFNNFSRQVTLVKQHGFYQIQATKERVLLSNRLIVKVKKGVLRESLVQYHSQVIKASMLFDALNSDYYLLEIKDKKRLSQVLKDIKQMSGVEQVQPDLLQLDHHLMLTLQASQRKIRKANRTPNRTAEELKAIAEKRAQRKANREERRKANKILREKDPSPYISLLDLESLWQETKGEGVKIAIIDDGFNLEHSDLQHLSPVFSYDSSSYQFNSAHHHHKDGHGTKVAGIIFAAHNQKGIDGIAPEAEIITIRQPDTWTSNTLLSFQLAKLAGASIVNCSWHSHWLLQPIAEIVDDLALHGRNGKGVAIIFAAGNEGKEILPESNEASINSAIVVGAQSAKYERLISSNYGDLVDIVIYGARAQTTLVSGKYGNFSATSLAASIVSGLSALLLSQNPEMTLDELIGELQLITKIKTEET